LKIVAIFECKYVDRVANLAIPLPAHIVGFFIELEENIEFIPPTSGILDTCDSRSNARIPDVGSLKWV